MNEDVWGRIKNTQRELQGHRETACLDIANELVWKLTGIKDHPYGRQVGVIAEELETIL